jgi:hypothetical protein
MSDKFTSSVSGLRNVDTVSHSLGSWKKGRIDTRELIKCDMSITGSHLKFILLECNQQFVQTYSVWNAKTTAFSYNFFTIVFSCVSVSSRS